jgi:hypothetical protein
MEVIMKISLKLLFLTLSLTCSQAFSMNHMEPVTTVTMTDNAGQIFDLDDQQYATFKQLPLIKMTNAFNDGQDFTFKGLNPSLTGKAIKRLLDILNQPIQTIRSLPDQECIELFEVARYFGLTYDEKNLNQKHQEVLYILAEKCWNHLSNQDLQDHRLIELKQCALEVLPYYPDINAFMEDAKKRAAQKRFDWSSLFIRNAHVPKENARRLLSLGLDCLYLSYENLSSLGFSKKLHSLKGIENISQYLDISGVKTLSIEDQEITDFSVKELKGLMPRLHDLDLTNNKITRLHKDQFDGMTNKFNLLIFGNPIQSVESDCFSSLGRYYDISIIALGIDASLFQDCHMECANKVKNTLAHARDVLSRHPQIWVFPPISACMTFFLIQMQRAHMSIADNWNELQQLEKAAFVGITGLGIGASLGVAVAKWKQHPVKHLTITCANDKKVQFIDNDSKPQIK